jgi:hypothetical protein
MRRFLTDGIRLALLTCGFPIWEISLGDTNYGLDRGEFPCRLIYADLKVLYCIFPNLNWRMTDIKNRSRTLMPWIP